MKQQKQLATLFSVSGQIQRPFCFTWTRNTRDTVSLSNRSFGNVQLSWIDDKEKSVVRKPMGEVLVGGSVR